jgi:hypothetical protein
MKKPAEVIKPRWAVFALRKRAERIGSVEARDQREAIERAVKQYPSPSTSVGAFHFSARRDDRFKWS